MTSIEIPKGVTSIGLGAFEGCSSLGNIAVDVNNQTYLSIDGILFNKDQTTLICYPAGKTEVAYTIPGGVTSIGGYALSYCSSLASIEIPSSVTSIGDQAFFGCSSLMSVEISSSVTSIGWFAFQSCSDLASITILSRDVEIDDSSYTLPTTATIYGYAGSTAQAYAEKYDRTFVILDEPIEPTESTEPTDTTEPGSEGGGSAVVWIIVDVVVVLAGIFIAVCVYQKKKK